MLKSRLLSAVSVSALVAIGAATDVLAQGAIEEIVVTARRREETLQSVPISISAFSSEQIQNRSIESLQNLANATPGMVFNTSANLTSNRPIIRGLSQQTRVGDEVNTAIFVDGVYSSGFSGSDIGFDGLERVEVARGPQSALYGRNSFAGAINYITKKPGDTLEWGGRGTIGTKGKMGISGYMSGPVVEDRVGARIDAGYSEPGGTFKNSVDGKRLNDRTTGYVRAGLRADPTDDIDMYMSYTYAQDDGSGTALTVISDTDPRRVGKPAASRRTPNPVGRRVLGEIKDEAGTYSFDPNVTNGDRESHRVSLNIDADMGATRLVALTGFEKRNVTTLSDLDTTPQGTPFTAGLVQNASGDVEDRNEISQDLRLQSNTDGAFDWLVGVYYSDEKFDDASVRYSTPGQGTTSPAPKPDGSPSVDERSIYKNKFSSIYGSLGYDFTEMINLSVEARYTWEDKSGNNVEDNFGTGAAPKGLTADKFKYFTPRSILTFKPNSDMMFYVSAAKGVKSGGFNANAVRPDERIYQPETNWTYETGAKLTFWDGRAIFNASVYHIDWTNQQTSAFSRDLTGAVLAESIIANVAKSQVEGGELQLNLAPTDHLRFDLGYGLTDAKYKNAVLSDLVGFVDCSVLNIECATTAGVLQTTGRVDGKRIEYTSKHTFSTGAELTLPITDDWDFYSRADFSWSSRKYVDSANLGWVPSREDLNLRLGVQKDNLKFQGFCNNVTNNRTPITGFPPRDFLGNPHFFVTNRDGRICGLTVAITN
ncbi:MAG: TonB-dependent receptor [Rhodospirillaceae bacterium]|nr:TonB-dependent receptor [Rhodospirillaceae bacterium]